MAHVFEVTLFDFQKVLTSLNVRSMQAIYVAMALGTLAYAGVVVFLSKFPMNAHSPSDPSLIRLLSYIHLLMGIILYILSKNLYHRTVGGRRFMEMAIPGSNDSQSSLSPAEMFFQSIRTASIIRLALMEGVAFFGLTICLIATQFGVLQEEPVYWLNTLSSLIFVVYVIRSIPTKERLENILREKHSMV